MGVGDIDIVLLFVIGEDADWQRSYHNYRKNTQDASAYSETGSHRFRSLRQPYNCVWSIVNFMPWVRKVHLVSAGQRIPGHNKLEELTNRKGGPILEYVDHKTIFSNPAHLPSFNSAGIQANLGGIPDLAEKIIYFEDDILVLNPLLPEQFFEASGAQRALFSFPRKLLRIEGRLEQAWQYELNNAVSCLEGAGFAPPYYSLMHYPIPYTREAYGMVQELFKAQLERTSSNAIRSNDDVSAFKLIVNLMLQRDLAAVAEHIRPAEIDLTHPEFFSALNNILQKNHFDVVNIIDDQSIVDTDPMLNELEQFFQRFRARKFVAQRKFISQAARSLLRFLRG